MKQSLNPSSGEGSVEYDAIASDYIENAERRSDRALVLLPSSQLYLGDVRGLSVLDLACGSGFFTRHIKLWGAESVTGVDASREMIEAAQRVETLEPCGINYRIGDVARMGRIGNFDKAFAAFLLHYAPSVSELRTMCQVVSDNLKPGGVFASLSANPFRPLHDGIKYDVAVTAHGPIVDGVKLTRTHYVGDIAKFSFSHFHYEPATYNQALEEAGFENIEWLPLILEPGHERDLPEGYWNEYLNEFSIRGLRATKKK